MEKFTLLITTKLRRVKYLRLAFMAILLPIRLPLVIANILGQWCESLDGVINDTYSSYEDYFIDRFKLNDAARKQYKENPKKFK